MKAAIEMKHELDRNLLLALDALGDLAGNAAKDMHNTDEQNKRLKSIRQRIESAIAKYDHAMEALDRIEKDLCELNANSRSILSNGGL